MYPKKFNDNIRKKRSWIQLLVDKNLDSLFGSDIVKLAKK